MLVDKEDIIYMAQIKSDLKKINIEKHNIKIEKAI